MKKKLDVPSVLAFGTLAITFMLMVMLALNIGNIGIRGFLVCLIWICALGAGLALVLTELEKILYEEHEKERLSKDTTLMQTSFSLSRKP